MTLTVRVVSMTDSTPSETYTGKSVNDIARTVFGPKATVEPCKAHINPTVTGYSVFLGKAEAGRIFAPKGTPMGTPTEASTPKPRARRRTKAEMEADKAAYDATPRCICKTSTGLDADNRCQRHPVSADVDAPEAAQVALDEAQVQIDAVKASTPRRRARKATSEDVVPSL